MLRSAQDHAAVQEGGAEIVADVVDLVNVDAGELPLPADQPAGHPDGVAELEPVFRIGWWPGCCRVIDLKLVNVPDQELTAQRVGSVRHDQHVPVADVVAADAELREPRAGRQLRWWAGTDTVAQRSGRHGERGADAAHLVAVLIAHGEIRVLRALRGRDAADLDDPLIVDEQRRVERAGAANPELTEPRTPERCAVALAGLLLPDPAAERAGRVQHRDLAVDAAAEACERRAADDQRLTHLDNLRGDVVRGHARVGPTELVLVEPASPRRDDRAFRRQVGRADLGSRPVHYAVLAAQRIVRHEIEVDRHARAEIPERRHGRRRRTTSR